MQLCYGVAAQYKCHVVETLVSLSNHKCLFIAALFFLTIVSIFFNLHRILSISRPLSGASVIIIEGWLPKYELEQCAQIFLRGNYQQVILAAVHKVVSASGDQRISNLEKARQILQENGVPNANIICIPACGGEKHNTFRSALAVREWLVLQLRSSPVKIDVVSGGAHALKTWIAYSRVLRGLAEVGRISVSPGEYNSKWWFLSKKGIIYTIYDFLGSFYSVVWKIPLECRK